MNETNAFDVGSEARQDLLAHPERPWPHAEGTARFVAGLAYAESHPHLEAPHTVPAAAVVVPLPTAAITGKYLSLTTFRRDGTGVATPVWFVREGARILVETDADSYKVRRIRRNPSVSVATCTATGRIRGEQVAATAELLADSETGRVERLFAHKYRVDMIFIRPVRALQAMLHPGRRRSKSVIVAITPT